MDKSAFLAWVQGREGRYELANGRVVMMTGALAEHGLSFTACLAVLNAHLAGHTLDAPTAELGLNAGPPLFAIPMSSFTARGAKRRGIGRHQAHLDFEVLSPSSATDRSRRQGHRICPHADVVRLFRSGAERAQGLGLGARAAGFPLEGPTVVSAPTSHSNSGAPVDLPLSEVYAEFLQSETALTIGRGSPGRPAQPAALSTVGHCPVAALLRCVTHARPPSGARAW